jgi:prephenate dehydrogenase
VVESRLVGPVRIVGVGLLGTSIGLGLRARGIDVILADASPTNLSIAIDYGAGRAAAPAAPAAPNTAAAANAAAAPNAAAAANAPNAANAANAANPDAPQLIVVCVPPDVTAEIVARELQAYPDAIVTDVASVKLAPLAALRAAGADVSRYIGSHPLAGRERGGPLAGRADLFIGRPWVVAAHDDISYQRANAVDDLILDLGAILVEMTPEEHDNAVALVSHVPQVVSTLMAQRLTDAQGSALNLAGGGLRDVTRIAASDPELWVQILGANAQPVRQILLAFRDDLDRFIDALDDPEA